jgi:hypothetical protein
MRHLGLALLTVAAGCAMASNAPSRSAPAAQDATRAQQSFGSAVAASPVQEQSTSVPGNFAPPPPPAPASTPYRFQADGPPSRQPVAGGAPAPTRPAPTPPEARPATPPRDAADEVAEAVRGYQAQIAAAVTAIAADGAACRDVCGATTVICRAASELCSLTGDGDRGDARDPRCRNARSACADASRRRDGACPLCPEPR